MIPNRDILRAILLERPVQTVQVLTEKFYASCIAELKSSTFFDCVFLDDDSTGSSFFSFFIFPRDRRSLRARDGSYNGIGLGLYLCVWHPIAAYGAISASASPNGGAGWNWLSPEKVQTLPSQDWSDVEQILSEILRRHSIAILTRDEAMTSLTSIELPAPQESNIRDDTDYLFFALFNNDY
jgi:hypothetical protein